MIKTARCHEAKYFIPPCIETLLTEAENLQDIARQREYTQKTNKLIEEARITLLDTEARHGVDIDTLWDSLDYATCNIHMIDMAPYEKKLDACKHDLPNLKRIRNRIQITKQYLAEMTSTTQKHMYGKYIKRIQELTLQATTDLLDIEVSHRTDISPTELKDFKTSLHNIERETSAVYSDLCTWKASNARPPAGPNEVLASFAGFGTNSGGSMQECAATVETKLETPREIGLLTTTL